MPATIWTRLCCRRSAPSSSSAGATHDHHHDRPARRALPFTGLHSDQARLEEALRRLDRRSFPADHASFSLLLEACCRVKSLELGKRLHGHIARTGLESNLFIANYIITMYGKCGSIKDTRTMFENMPRRNTVSWNAIISVYASYKQSKKALHLLQRMLFEGFPPKKNTFITALSACAHRHSLLEVGLIHESVVDSGLELDTMVGNALINAYGKCGSAEDAGKMFDKMVERDEVTWNSMIAAYAQNGYGKEAFSSFKEMHMHSVKPSEVSFVNLLSACSTKTDLSQGKLIHDLIRERGFESDTFVGTALLTMYGKCESVEDARLSFDRITKRSIVTWNAMIGVNAAAGDFREALQLFERMQKECVRPNNITFLNILDACKCSAAL